MKRLLIKLTGLMLTAAIVLSASGTALALENEDPAGDVGVTSEEPAADPKEEEPAADPAPASDPAPAAEEPADEEPEDEEPKAEEPADDKGEPAAEPQGEQKKDEDPQDKGTVTAPKTVEKHHNVKLDKTNDELAQAYIDHVFGKNASLKKRSFNYASLLEGRPLDLYNSLHTEVERIAAGQRNEAIFHFNFEFTTEELGLTDLSDWDLDYDRSYALLEVDTVIDVLLQACPYDLYWFGKTEGYKCPLKGSSSGNTFYLDLTIQMTVAEDYRAANGDKYHVDTTYGQSAINARGTALQIIEENKNRDDVSKLRNYVNTICQLTDYNDAAASEENPTRLNPWQMIWVFDNNPDTKVVCEGYSKAFQFLCDNTTFQSNEIYALSVTGFGGSPNDCDKHMWNVVHMDDGKFYHVDVTFFDSGLNTFLRGKDSFSHIDGGYDIVSGSDVSVYVYDGDTQTPEIATSDYTPIEAPQFYSNHGMVLGGDIGVRFVVAFPSGYDTSNCYVEFSISDGRTEIVPYSKTTAYPNDPRVRYFVCHINALELADTITAILHYDNDKTIQNSYSAMRYIQYVRTNYSGNDNYTHWVKLVNSLQDYGHYLQLSGWTDNYEHEAIPISDDLYALSSVHIQGVLNQVDGYGIKKNGLVDSGINSTVKVALALTSQTELRVSVKLNSGVQMVSTDCTERVIDGETYYMFSVKDISPADFGTEQTITIQTNLGTATVKVSVLHYVKVALNSDSFTRDQKIALAAYYYYYAYARDYVDSE